MHDEPDPAQHDELSRRRLLRGGAAGLGAAFAAGGLTAGGVHYAETQAARHRAFAAKHAPAMPSSTRLLWRAETEEPVLALTFDDGPDPSYTTPLLDLLAEHAARATFFVCGRRVVRHRELLRRQVAGRHEVGNHTWGHVDLAMLSPAEVRQELATTSQAIVDAVGTGPAVLRPPWGRISGTAMQVAAEQELDVMVWDVRLRDRETDVAGNVEHVLDSLRPGMVLLGHDAGPLPRGVGIAAMPGIIRGARERGFRFVTASEMLELDRTQERRSAQV